MAGESGNLGLYILGADEAQSPRRPLAEVEGGRDWEQCASVCSELRQRDKHLPLQRDGFSCRISALLCQFSKSATLHLSTDLCPTQYSSPNPHTAVFVKGGIFCPL